VSTRVAIPILFVSVKMNLVRGRRWSVVEHALLSSLCANSSSIRELSVKSGLTMRLVVEAVIRLMKVGWVEMTETQSAILLRATDRGKQVADRDELPKIRHPFSRIGKFAVDEITGQLFRAKDLNIYLPATVEDYVKEGRMIHLTSRAPKRRGIYHQGEAISMLLDEDEEYVSTDEIGPRESNRFAVVNVRGEQIEGLPLEYDSPLRDLILEQIKDPNGKVQVLDNQESLKRTSIFEESVNIKLNSDSLVVGGDAHQKAIVSALKHARTWVVIHSTFINVESFHYLAPHFKEASDRGIRISLLWGQSELSASRGQTLASIRECQRILQGSDGGASVHFQPFSTGSHAKILLYDSGRHPMVAVLGSCNWLSSGFDRIEVSLKLTDHRIVKLIAIILSELARPSQGHWSALSSDLAGYAANLERYSDSELYNCTARLVLGSDHNDVVLRARDRAKSRIMVGSHRISLSARSLALAPMLSAIRERGVAVRFRYSKVEPELKNIENLFNSEEELEFRSAIDFAEVKSPLLHAKFLCWDDDNLLVTSQNLLSADPGGGELFSEIGIHLQSRNVAKYFEQKLSQFGLA